MVLFIVVVCIGVMAINSTGTNVQTGRQLLEIPRHTPIEQYKLNSGKNS